MEATFTVTLSGKTADRIAVDYATGPPGNAPRRRTTSQPRHSEPPGRGGPKVIPSWSTGTPPTSADETFSLDLSAPTNATIDDGHGVGTIIDDDVPTFPLSVDTAGPAAAAVSLHSGRDRLRGRLHRGLRRGHERHADGGADGELDLLRLVGRMHRTGSCIVSMTQARGVTATFTVVTHTLSVARAGTRHGLDQVDPGGIDCGSDCAETLRAGHASSP